MPIYEYKCAECRREFELLILSSSEEPRCPSCGAADVERRMSVCSSVKGGSGFRDCPSAESCPSASCCSGGLCRH